MRFLQPLFAVATLAAALSFAPLAAAQAGSVIVLDYERVVATSDVGRDMTTKLQQIGQQMDGELSPERTAIETEQRRLQQAAQGMSSEQVRANTQLSQQVEALGQRAETFRQRQISLARDLEYTRQRTLMDFNAQITPVVQEVMTARGAGVVIDASTAQLYAPNLNVTDDVIQRLNQRVRTMNVTRQSAPPPQQQQQQQ